MAEKALKSINANHVRHASRNQAVLVLLAGGRHEALSGRLPRRRSLCLRTLPSGRPAAALPTGGRPAAPSPVGVVAVAQQPPESGGPSTGFRGRRLWG